jgi:hypothetical protein
MQEMFDASWHIPKNINTGKVETEKVKNSNTSVIAKGSIPLYQIQEESHVAKKTQTTSAKPVLSQTNCAELCRGNRAIEDYSDICCL